MHDATTNDNRVFCCEEEEEEDPHAAPLREGGGVVGDGIISSIFFLCGVFVFRFHQEYVLLRIKVYIIGSGRFFFFLRGGGAFFFFGRIVV